MAQHHYSDHQGYTSDTSPSQEEEHFLEPELTAEGLQLHLATLGEKKRLWWRNAVINTLFILSWCVLVPYCLRIRGFDRCI